MKHSTDVMTDSTTDSDADRSSDFVVGYDLGWRHGALDTIKLLPQEQRTALMNQLEKQPGW